MEWNIDDDDVSSYRMEWSYCLYHLFRPIAIFTKIRSIR